ncbi:hypothetical protein BGZ46_006762 [Entomortierella lignicola]|nr:hypothetical protein BGZ46_006762 [Entomortierella lignicola]
MVKVASILLLSAACAIASADLVTLPLRRNETPNMKTIVHSDRRRWANMKSGSKIIPATNELAAYFIDVDIGTPAQTTSLLFDTGSSTLWVSNVQYDASKSKSAKDLKFSNELQYGSGNVSIEYYKDKVSIGGKKIRQNFGVAQDTSKIGVYGIIGFGPTDLNQVTRGSKTYDDPTPMDNLKSAHQISKEVVGVYFKPISDGSLSKTNGQVDIGGVDSRKYKGKLHYIPITKRQPASYYWGVDIDSISFGGIPATILEAGIVDTGTTLIMLAEYILEFLFLTVGGYQDQNSGLYVIPKGKLSDLKDVTFNLNGKPFSLSPQQYLIPNNQFEHFGLTKGIHYTYFAPMGLSGIDAIIGMKFLENYYSVYDTTNNRVGLAPRK